ncbi:MAG TPA: gluconokinase [Rubrobacteraceae bacterium]|nr:gluconokinase [Rubrobacteraceae bacterium]
MSSSEHVMSIDVGSSSVRCALYDGAGSLVERTRTNFVNRFEITREGGATIDADKLCELIFRAVDKTLAHAGPRHICGVGLSTFWHGVLGVDRREDPTTPVFTWADRRAAGAAELLRERLDETAIHRSTGCMLHSSYLPAKLLWLSHAYPRQFEETTRWLSLGEYLYLKLFGDAAVGTSIAAGTGLFAQNRRGWDTQLLNELPVHVKQLSPVSDEPMRGLRGEFARRWATLRDVPWFPALGDGACSNVGSGCVGRDRLALMVGTSGAMRMLWRAGSVEPPAGLWCYRVDASRFVSGGALSDGGNLVAWLRKTLRLPEPEKTEELLATMQPGAHGLTFLPLLAGERGPGWTDKANGTIAGLSLATEPIEILRSAMEAIALRFALIAQRLDGAFPPEIKGREIVASGGGLLGSPAWTQIMADALGRSITVSAVAEASSRGAALLALEALGGPKAEKHEAPLGVTHKPDPLRQEAYREALENQRELYDVLRGRA